MAITAAVCNSFKTEVMEGTHALETDVLKIALYSSSATLDKDTTVYSASNEVAQTGYTAGGATLASVAVTLDTDTAIVDADDPTWSITGSMTARGALIYNTSQANKAVAVLDFGADVSVTNGQFTVTLPAPAAATAMIQLT